jgi:hypothetical protein
MAATLIGLGDFRFLENLPHLSAQDVQVLTKRVKFSADIEPLVRLIEETDRAKLLEVAAERIRRDATYQELLAAVMLAGVRSIQPRPLGFKFHAVMVIHSAHLASMAAKDKDRWLPLFWALDNFKASQERNRREGNWSMREVSDLPSPQVAKQRFLQAMDRWDVDGADKAIAAWCRVASQNEVYEAFWRLGARDFRNLAHKAIYVANSYRTLNTIGWRHAEPIVRSLAYGLLDHESGNPAERDDDRDRSGRDNAELVKTIRNGWQQGKVSAEASQELLQVLRIANAAEASAHVVKLLNNEIDPSSIWDGIFLGAGELLVRQPGIAGLHTCTSMNAMHFGYQTTLNDETRRYLLLQAAAYLPQFRKGMASRKMGDTHLDELKADEPQSKDAQIAEEIFNDVSRDRMQAARKTLQVLTNHPEQAEPLMAAARRLVFSKGTDSHDYKFSSAVLEDFYHLTPAWRNRYLASSMAQLQGAGGGDTDLVKRIRAAVSG